MFQTLARVALVALVAVVCLAAATAAEPKETGVKPKDPPKELSVDLGKGIKLEMVLIPAGEFKMGSPDSDKDAEKNEKPQHRVRITKPFYMGKYLVTQEQWEAVMGNNPSYFKGPKNPVETVSWDDCQKLLEKLNAKVGTKQGKFVLPTEAQWEYACRAGSTTRYYFGDDKSKLGEYAWYEANSDTMFFGLSKQTHPVGKKKPNAWGLYDMHGNVCEWCLDFYDFDYYANSPVDDPSGPITGKYRMVRGGTWHSGSCRSADHGCNVPDRTVEVIGVRVALILADKVPTVAEPTPATPKQITNSIGSCQTCPIGPWWHHLQD